MRRAIYKDAKPKLVAKFSLANDKERLLNNIWHILIPAVSYGISLKWFYPICVHRQLRFQMLKSWVQNQDVGEIDIEEKYVTFVRTLRTDRYTTVRAPLFKIKTNQCSLTLQQNCWASPFFRWFDLPYPLVSSKVTIFQLEKIYGKGQEAKAFIQELCRGSLAIL